MTKAPTAPGKPGTTTQAWLLMLLPGLFWAGNAIVGRAVAGELPPVGLAFWRWAAGTALVLPFAWRHLRHDLRVILRAWPVMLALSVFGVAIFNTFLYMAAQTTTALNIVMLQSAMPVAIVATTFLLYGERVTARQGLGILVSLFGALTLVAHGDPGVLLHLGFNTGDLWMLGAVASYAVYTALLRRRPGVHGLSFLVATFATGALLLLPFHAVEVLRGHPMPLATTALLAIGYVSVFASILAYLSFNRAVALLGPNLAGLAVHLVPAFGTVLAILLLGEAPRLYHAVGIALIAAGILLATRT